MRHALFILEEEIAFLVDLKAQAAAELEGQPAGLIRAHLWRLDSQIDELEAAHATLKADADPMAALHGMTELPLFPELH